MVTAAYQPRLEATAAVLRAAVDGSGMTRAEAARHIGVSGSMLSTMIHAKSPVSAERARKLGALLHIDPATITSPSRSGEQPRPSKPRQGPAARAVALHARRAAVVEVIPPQAPPPRAGLYGLEEGPEGLTVWLRATLPRDADAVARFLALLDMATKKSGDGG